MSENQLFSLAEAISRLGQMRGKGSLMAFNGHGSVHIFVEDGTMIGAFSGNRHGEAALEQALSLPDCRYVWSPGIEPLARNLKVNIQEFVLRHALAHDVKVGTATKAMPARKPSTKTDEIARIHPPKKEEKFDFTYTFVGEQGTSLLIRLSKTTSILGRDEYCDVVLEHPQVSRRHCVLQLTDRGVLVKDLDSTNGTFANGIPLKDGYVSPGDVLSLGSLGFSLKKEKKRLSGGRLELSKL